MSDRRRSSRPGNQRPSAQASIVFRQQRPLVLRSRRRRERRPPTALDGGERAPAARTVNSSGCRRGKICDFGVRHRQRTPRANRIRRQKTRPSGRSSLVKAASTARLCAHKTDSSPAFAWPCASNPRRPPAAVHWSADRPRFIAALFTGLLTPGDCSSLIKRESSRSGA